MNQDGGFHMSQGLDVLPPKSGPAYPIPCVEWDALKDHARRLSPEPWFFHTVGSILLGSSFATWITIVVGTFDKPDQAKAHIIAWAVVGVTLLSGLLCMLFAHKERDVKRQRASDLITQMDLIERRFERQPV
jgi:Na+/melibiose symporter-like transporter